MLPVLFHHSGKIQHMCIFPGLFVLTFFFSALKSIVRIDITLIFIQGPVDCLTEEKLVKEVLLGTDLVHLRGQ